MSFSIGHQVKKASEDEPGCSYEHVKSSGVFEAIRLGKPWRARNYLSVRYFVLELFIIEMLKHKKSLGLPEQLKHVWTELRDNIDEVTIEDPANPTGNDLSELFNSTIDSI